MRGQSGSAYIPSDSGYPLISKCRMNTSRLYIDPEIVKKASEDDWANAFARIENHYFVNEGFMREGQLLEKQGIDKMLGRSNHRLAGLLNVY